MKKNKMSVLTLSCRPLYYLRHPLKLFHELYWNCRNFIHRGRFGFGYVDVWCMDEYLLGVIPMMLRHLAEHSCGYPGIEPFETYEKYQIWLRRLAYRFEECQEDRMEHRNEYSEQFNKMCDEKVKEMIENKETTMELKEKEIKNKYFERSKEIGEERDKMILEAYTELAENHTILWD